MLTKKLEGTRSNLNAEIPKVDQRVSAVTANLAEHHRDTVAHTRYHVQEK